MSLAVLPATGYVLTFSLASVEHRLLMSPGAPNLRTMMRPSSIVSFAKSALFSKAWRQKRLTFSSTLTF
jgi:hypothetical protein